MLSADTSSIDVRQKNIGILKVSSGHRGEYESNTIWPTSLAEFPEMKTYLMLKLLGQSKIWFESILKLMSYSKN